MTKAEAKKIARRGFDKCLWNLKTGVLWVRCSQCQAFTINGIACHEHGCPKSNPLVERNLMQSPNNCQRCCRRLTIHTPIFHGRLTHEGVRTSPHPTIRPTPKTWLYLCLGCHREFGLGLGRKRGYGYLWDSYREIWERVTDESGLMEHGIFRALGRHDILPQAFSRPYRLCPVRPRPLAKPPACLLPAAPNYPRSPEDSIDLSNPYQVDSLIKEICNAI